MATKTKNVEGEWSEMLEEGALRVGQAVAFSGVGRSFLYEAMTRGELKYFKAGSARLIPKRALVEFLARQAAGGEMIPA
jgi:excisionase family DNA binding protein